MISTAASIPLTLCSVVIRRFIDSYTGRLPLEVAASTVPTASTVALFSGALFCLYHQLRRGTLVKIGMGRRLSSMINSSRHTIQRRMKNSSWFLRNLGACRRKCTEAMLRMAHQSNDSLQNIQAETGIVVETNSLPIFRKSENCRNLKHASELPIEDLYSNDSFDTHDCSIQDVRTDHSKRNQLSNPKRRNYNVVASRPVTRNSRKCTPEYTHEDGKNRLPSRKRKKPEVILNEPEVPNLVTSRPEVTRHIQRQLRIMSTEETTAPPKILSRRYSERIKKQPKVQKITRKTRSGRVYAYRL